MIAFLLLLIVAAIWIPAVVVKWAAIAMASISFIAGIIVKLAGWDEE